MNIQNALIEGAKILKSAYIMLPEMEARILLAHTIKQSQEYLLLNNDNLLSNRELQKFFNFIMNRQKGIPIAYLIGYKEFYGRNFVVDSSVLIPRPDSEILVESVIVDYINHKSAIKILELGVGSGCLIITLLLELSNVIGVGIDISLAALDIAQQNCKNYELTESLKLIPSNWFSNLEVKEQYDVIIANPPYIDKNEHENIATETMLYEPPIALFADNYGLSHYYKIAQSASHFLNKNGRLYLEFGYNQSKKIIEIFESRSWIAEKKYYDLAGHCRCLKFKI